MLLRFSPFAEACPKFNSLGTCLCKRANLRLPQGSPFAEMSPRSRCISLHIGIPQVSPYAKMYDQGIPWYSPDSFRLPILSCLKANRHLPQNSKTRSYHLCHGHKFGASVAQGACISVFGLYTAIKNVMVVQRQHLLTACLCSFASVNFFIITILAMPWAPMISLAMSSPVQ